MADIVSTSKFISLVLRHRPSAGHVTLDENGWVAVDALLAGCVKAGKRIDRALLDRVVEENNKRRFEYSPDGLRIRARQGHSVGVDLGYAPTKPPERLFHGTATHALDGIRRTGLEKRARHAVHLSGDETTARSVGGRHGTAVVLVVRARDLAETGAVFHLTDNGVWLTDHVPPAFIDFP